LNNVTQAKKAASCLQVNCLFPETQAMPVFLPTFDSFELKISFRAGTAALVGGLGLGGVSGKAGLK